MTLATHTLGAGDGVARATRDAAPVGLVKQREGRDGAARGARASGGGRRPSEVLALFASGLLLTFKGVGGARASAAAVLVVAAVDVGAGLAAVSV